MDRRTFLKNAGIAAAAGTAMSVNGNAFAMARKPTPPTGNDYRKYLQAKDISKTTLSAMKKIQREEILDLALKRIPTPDRVEQIFETVMTHIVAEEQNDVEMTMSTMIENPVFEDVAAGAIIQGHKNIAADYAGRFNSFPSMKRTITNFMVDAQGVWVELIWEGYQRDSVKGVKPPKNVEKFVLPVAAYFDVNEQGLISRETAYYDQYLGLVNLDILPDVINNKALLLLVNPGLVTRLDRKGYR
ncbi:nuclear transport factor 2 family protein [Bdellovibrio bacteriovorus]|uniref:SnoaL-like domain-containing protein n=1 Tax=Bdellovibrio bacteriovorus str. Tiberius TaxID=1069642 RepID=K7YM12_BDEBC|nr:nuclear transport factor 2 family protein [Bdellovibrio bacteriovorus]AFY00821.1 conserved hypothetical protein, steroid delta-isomerase-related protein [Bdellovibrio bacteriovorus str. Tiberius]